MKIVITGASGFVGRSLVSYLQNEGHEVVPVSLRGNFELPKFADALIHLAARSTDNGSDLDSRFFDVNLGLTQELCKEFLKTEVPIFIFFSSVKALKDTSDKIITEETTPEPSTAYGKSKLAAENYLFNELPQEGRRLFIVRPSAIYGPGTTDNISLLFKLVKYGFPWPFAAFDNKRSFLFIENLNFVVSKILKSRLKGGVFNVADDEFASTNDLIKILSNIFEKKQKLIYVPRFFFTAIAKLGDVLRLPFNSNKLEKITGSYIVSNKKIKTQLEIEKMPISLKLGLEKTIQSFKNIP